MVRTFCIDGGVCDVGKGIEPVRAETVKVTSKKSAHPSFISILCIFLTRLLKKRAPNVLFYPYSGANPPRIWKYSLNWA